MTRHHTLAAGCLALAALATAFTAAADTWVYQPAAHPPLDLFSVFASATVVVKLSMVALLAAAVASMVLAVLRRGGRPVHLLQVISVAAPVLGLFGASFGLTASFLGIANSATTPPLTVLAPGAAEALAVLSLGLLASFLAIVARGWIEAKDEDAPRAVAPRPAVA